MENEKKPQRLAVRLSALFAAVMLLVALAVPVFAYQLEDLPGEWVLSETIECDSILSKDGKSVVGLTCSAYFIVDGQIRPIYSLAFRVGNRVTYRETGSEMGGTPIYENGSWVDEDYRYIYITDVISSDENLLGAEAFFLNASPVPPDPMESVGSGLTVVIDWVGATVSALFSGELAGLLPLVAIPVAITILIVAIVVIKRSIWGA